MALTPRLAPNALTTPEAMQMLIGPSVETLPDGQLVLLINAASAWIEGQLQRQLGKRTYTERCKTPGRQNLILRHWPILSVDYVRQAGETIALQLYEIEPEGYVGILYKDDGWTYEGYRQGLTNDYVANKRSIEVRYTAGYILPKDATEETPATLPGDIEMLCWEMVQRIIGKMQNGGMAGLKTFAISDVRWEWDNEIPQTWQQTLDLYRRKWI